MLFNVRTAPFAMEREWHPSQKFDLQKDGGVLMTMDVCNDYALQRWVLSFGSGAVVVEPLSLANRVADELEQGLTAYRLPRMGAPSETIHPEGALEEVTREVSRRKRAS